jgi:hypothetical protein
MLEMQLSLEQYLSWRRLGRAQPFGHTLDTGGVGALCGLGCALPFDYVDGAVPVLGLGGPRPFDYSGESSSWVVPPSCPWGSSS